MFTTTQAVDQNRVSILIYGPPKIGKTSLALSLVNHGYRPLVLNMENGLLSLKSKKIDVYDCTVDANGVPMERKYRVQKLVAFLKDIASTPEIQKKYDTLMLDSVSETCQCMLEIFKEKYPDRKDSLVMFGELGDSLADFVKQLRDLKPYNIVMTSHDAIDKDDHGRRFTGVDLTGKMSRRIIGLLDEVAYMKNITNEEGRSKRFLITSELDNALAGDRSGKLELYEEADLGLIFDKILCKGEQQ